MAPSACISDVNRRPGRRFMTEDEGDGGVNARPLFISDSVRIPMKSREIFLTVLATLVIVVGIVLSMTLALLKFHDLLHPLLCLGWFVLVQGIEGGIITPRIVGEKVGLHPVVTILAFLIGGQLFGILGMILAVPVTAVLKVEFRALIDYYRASAFFQGA
jgi:hypothetical protein